MGRQVTLTFSGKDRICWFTDLLKNKSDPVIEREENNEARNPPSICGDKSNLWLR